MVKVKKKKKKKNIFIWPYTDIIQIQVTMVINEMLLQKKYTVIETNKQKNRARRPL